MDKMIKIAKFYFINSFKGQLLIAAAVLLFHLLLSVTIINLVTVSGTAGSNDVIVMVWIFVLGLVIFTPSFKYLLSSGGVPEKIFYSHECKYRPVGGSFCLTLDDLLRHKS